MGEERAEVLLAARGGIAQSHKRRNSPATDDDNTNKRETERL